MNGRFELEDPEKMEATLTLTMNLAAWKELSIQLDKKWPSSDLGSLIADVLSKAHQAFFSQKGKDK